MSPLQVLPCCAPTRARARIIEASRVCSANRITASGGSTENMLRLDGGRFLMGSEDSDAFVADGEGPVRPVVIDPFYIDRYPVTNEQFSEFVKATGYRTEAEVFRWSFVFEGHLTDADRLLRPLGVSWWCKVEGADWQHPEGPQSTVVTRHHYPAVHVSWNDAMAYTAWSGKRLPTEAEWEFAARGGLEGQRYPWGDELTPEGHHLCNIWQGTFPDVDLAEDGYSAPAPVDAFPANGFGLHSITGNTWEWCADWFSPDYHRFATRLNPVGPAQGQARSMRGGSYLCHESYCNRYRVAARTSNTPDSSTTNLGFRCVRDV